MFALPRFCYIRRGYIFFIIFYYYYGEENRSSYRGLHYIEALYIEVPTVHTKMERDGLSIRLSSLLRRHHCPESK